MTTAPSNPSDKPLAARDATNSPKGPTPPSTNKSAASAGIEATLRIGPAGWSYPDWTAYVYPSHRPKGFHEAAYLAGFFDTIEINTSFYNPIRPDHAAQWIELVAHNSNFMFTAKLWQRFTHDSGPVTQVSPFSAPSADDERAVRLGFDVLHSAGKLGAVLLQFPFSFHRTRESVSHLSALLKRFADYPLVVEVRHASWLAPETFALLEKFHAAFCNIDQPLIGRSVRPSAEATSSVGYVRLHGRRYDTWFSDDESIPSHERYNYLYSSAELAPWAERIDKVAQRSRNVYVITNNHYRGKAVVNALELISILRNSKVKVPEPLREHFPQLDKIADSPPATPTLFPLEKLTDQ
jgi:uncharacterized protein YecE (DUF72 family)